MPSLGESKKHQRLRWVKAKSEDSIEAFFSLNSSVRIVHGPSVDVSGKKYICWFIPLDRDIKSREIKE